MGTPHKHAELIKAWADGADIQVKNGDIWSDMDWNPKWDEQCEYRIRPVPKFITKMVELSLDKEDMGYAVFSGKQSNLRVVFDANTKDIVEVEIIA